MKVFIIAILAIAQALAQATPRGVDSSKIKIPEKCSDVLAVKVCDRLDNMAKKLHLKSEEVKKAVKDAYIQGKRTSEELYKKSKEILQKQVLSKKCEDLTTVENCQKLRKIAADMKIKADQVADFIMKELANLKTKECEDYLTTEQCTKLTEVTNKLKMRLDQVEEYLMEAYLDTKTNGKKMLIETYEKVKTYVMTTRCEDMFNPDLCTSFRKYANKTRVALPHIMETAYNLVQTGVAIGKGFANRVYNIVDYFYDCEDVFTDNSCDRLKKWAAKLKVTAQEVEKAVKKYVRVFIEKSTTIYQTIKDFVKDKIYCRFSSKCVNIEDSDELLQDEQDASIDFKERVRKVLNEKFSFLEASMRAKVENMIARASSFAELFKSFGHEVKTNAEQKWRSFFMKLMIFVYA